MGYTKTGRGFELKIQSGFVGDRHWLVYGELDYGVRRNDADVPLDVIQESRFELLLGVVTESRVGWALGAREVDVLVDGDCDVARALPRGSRGGGTVVPVGPARTRPRSA